MAGGFAADVRGEGKIIPGCELRNKSSQYIIAMGVIEAVASSIRTDMIFCVDERGGKRGRE
jgi:hypothetical protein